MFERLSIPDVFTFTPQRYADERGYFCETFNKAALEALTGPVDWVQDNYSMSARRGVVRGLHFQAPPFAQDKLVRCQRGSVLDVAVDIRHGSPTFGRHVAVQLTSARGEQVFIPKGFAHGFVTLEDGCEVSYKVSAYYSPAHAHAIRWDDPALGIDWGVDEGQATLSKKDADAAPLAATPAWFRLGGDGL